jgi:hypothetical protein
MAIFEVKKENSKDLLQLFRKLNYITDWCSTRQDLIYGSDVSTIDTYEEMVAVKNVYDQTERSAYMHYVLSLPENEKITLSRFKALSIEVCELFSAFYGDYQVLMAVHVDTDNLHTHYVANTIDCSNGNRFDLNWRRFEEIQQKISGILIKYGLSPVKMNP